jgi:basic membrane protein A and related proteins
VLDDESHYLCGMVAGAMSKSGKIGFVAAHPFGLVNWVVNGYEMGIKKANPTATLTTVFTGSWDDPVKERAAAEALADQGVDVIGEHVNGRNLLDFWNQEFVPGPDGGAKICLRRVGRRVEAESVRRVYVDEGRKHGRRVLQFRGAESCCRQGHGRARCHPRGKQVFAGPVVDRDGKERVAAGQGLSDADLWKMDWFVQGVITQK